tara:strand:+ start:328 stop:627 length:300 start_codon:yes stop_codon:yes gene_type:complete
MDIDLKGSPFAGLTQEEFGVLARLMDQNQQNPFQKAEAVGTGLLDRLIRDKGVKMSAGKRTSVKIGTKGAEATFKPGRKTVLKAKIRPGSASLAYRREF